tara:strand:+ start:176 stop:349 length:174 start_codon:yes stop_codon:yes gene_type:complete
MERKKYIEPKTSFNFDALPENFESMQEIKWYKKTIFFMDDDFLYPEDYLKSSDCFPE